MKKISAWLVALFIVLPFSSHATESPNVELGRQLFESKQLGSNGKSCSSCHPGGKGLEEISAYDNQTLKEMINFCIRDALKGTMLDLESQELDSMLVYLRTFPTR